MRRRDELIIGQDFLLNGVDKIRSKDRDRVRRIIILKRRGYYIYHYRMSVIMILSRQDRALPHTPQVLIRLKGLLVLLN